MFSIIDKYVAKSFLYYFFIGLIAIVGLFLIVDYMGSFARHETTLKLTLEYYKYYIPLVIYQMLPVAVLFSTLFTLSSLTRFNEVTAMLTMGLSYIKALRFVFVFAFILSILSFYFSDSIIPGFTDKKNYTYHVKVRNKPWLYSSVRKSRIWFKSDNFFLNIQKLTPESGLLEGVMLYEFDKSWKLSRLINSKSAKVEKENQWVFEDGVEVVMSSNQFSTMSPFLSLDFTGPHDFSDLKSAQKPAEVMKYSQIREFIKKSKESGVDPLSYEVDLHAKIALAFASLIMVFLGFPFGLRRRRSSSGLSGIVLCLGLVFIYFVSINIFSQLGKYAYLPVLLAAWGPNLLACLFASVGFKKLAAS